MKSLVLGGGVFLGWHIAVAAARRGPVTAFRRGRSGSAPPGASTVLGDRRRDLDRLSESTFDVVFDCCGYEPEDVARSCDALKNRVGRYVFVSSVLAYADLTIPGMREDAPTYAASPLVASRASDPTSYGKKKALCEAIVLDRFGEAATIVRPGYIVGPRDQSVRMARWVARGRLGGRVIVPPLGSHPWQFIDVRDVADFLVGTAEVRCQQTWNVAGPAQSATGRAMVEEIFEVCGRRAMLVEYPRQALDDARVRHVLEQTDWADPPPCETATYTMDTSRARRDGLRHRPVVETCEAIGLELAGRSQGPGSEAEATFHQATEREWEASRGSV